MPILENEFESYSKEFKFSRGIPEFIANKERFKNSTLYDEKHSMSNSEIIDPILEQVIEAFCLSSYIFILATDLYNPRFC